MTGKELRAYRDKRGWTQKQMCELLNESLGRNYAGAKLSKWERDVEPVPKHVGTFLTELQLEEALPSNTGLLTDPGEFEHTPVDSDYEAPPEHGPEDSAPPPPPGAAEQAAQLLPTGNRTIYARMCEEMFEMVATGLGLIGAATNNQTLTADSHIILADKEKLGRAYGKLAETNKTFQRMLTGGLSSGAYLEVALVTGVTTGKLLRNHQAARITAPPPPPEPAPEPTEWSMNGDSGVVQFPVA